MFLSFLRGGRRGDAPVQSASDHMRQVPDGRFWWAAAFFLLLASFHTWPLATGTVSRIHDDVWLNAWAVSWIARQLFRDPLNLFDANIFYPHHDTLAYTEPLIIPGLLAAPIHWLGGSALLAHNTLVLLGYTFTALAMYVLVRSWTGDHRAGLLSGALFAFSTALMTRTAHLQAVHIYWLPLAFLAFQHLLTHRRTRDAAWLGLCVLGAALTSGYLIVFVFFALAAAALVRIGEFGGRDGARLLLRLAAAAVVTVAILLVVLRPYVEVGHQRSPARESAELVTALESYLASAAVLHYRSWSTGFYDSAPGTLFPGVVTIALAAVAISRRRSITPRGCRRMLLAAAGVGLLLSLGTHTPVYTWAYEAVPPLRGLRAIHRFGILVVFALAALAGIGLSGCRWPASQRRRTLATAVLLVLATGESFHGWGSDPWLDQAGRIHRYLGASSWPGAVVELPIYRRREFHRNARYLLASTVHWRPLVNGFGGFAPPGFDDTVRLARAFPSVLTVAWLQEIGVGWVIVHLDRYDDPLRTLRVLSELQRRRDLALSIVDGATRLYQVRPEKAPAIGALVPAPTLSQLRFVDGPADGSMLRSAGGVRRAFGFQSPRRFIAYLESTTPESFLTLRLPVPMTGRFVDAATGSELQEVTVPASTDTEPPARVYAPPGHAAVILDLQAEQ